MLMRTDPFRFARDHGETQVADRPLGVLTLRIPVAEKAKPRKITITAGDSDRREIST